MPTLDQVNAFLNTTKDAREYKRAMAVKLLLLEFEPRDIAELLQVTESFVSKWKKLCSEHGVAVFVIKYHGYQGYLTSEQPIALNSSHARVTMTCSPRQVSHGNGHNRSILTKILSALR